MDGSESYNYSATVTCYWERTVYTYTQNPQITVAGQITQHTGTLALDEVTAWYDALGFVANTTNNVLHDDANAIGADVEIEVVIGSVWVYAAGAWKQVTATWVYQGGSWKSVVSLSANIGGTWKQT
jgi:hypothetical protein